MKANDEELELSSESCERWAWGCGAVVVVAILGEFAIAISAQPERSFWPVWGTATADFLIAAGVAGEIIFAMMGFARQRELNRRSGERVAQLEFDAGFAQESAAKAAERAAVAELALCELESRLAPRKLTQEGQKLIADRISRFARITGEIGSAPPEIESMRLESGIHAALSMGGWAISRGHPTHTPMWPGGIVVNTSGDPVSMLAGVALAEALIELGLYAVPMPMLDGPPGRIFVTVGTKPEATDFEDAEKIIAGIKEMVNKIFNPSSTA